jgi:protein TonB
MTDTSTEDVARVNTSHGHLSVRVEGAHPPEVRFSFEQRPSRTALSVVASIGLDGIVVLLVVLLGRLPHTLMTPPINVLSDQIVWLDQKGPGGGGGGGGNQTPLPPKPAEIIGKQKITVPVTPPAPVVAPRPPKADPDPIQQVVIPALEQAAALQNLPGVIAPPGALNLSQGPGRGGGAGTGSGTGIGPGSGSGLGPGFGGGTGGGAYQPGNGVTSPIPLNQPKPAYTPEAMRARIQGTARIKCIVQPNGVCTNIEIEHSLDPTFGLDQEAVKSVQLWRFKPGLRFGQAVPVLVTIDVEFALR